MPVVEAPCWDSWPGGEGAFAPNGVFVLLKIDPVASVANLDDEETTRAAAALDRHEWVLGVVVGHSGGVFLDPQAKPVMSLQFEIFAQGVPADKAIASIPVAPSAQLYDDRPPLQLNAPLPWPNLYVHTNFSSSVIISRIHYGAATFEANMTKAQYEDLLERAFADRYNWHDLPPVTIPDPVDVVVHAAESQPSGSRSSNDTGDSSSDEEDSLFLQEREEIGTKLIRRRIYAEISLDPSMCPGPLGAPVQMEEPVKRIRELWDEWEERRMAELLAKRPQTTAWALGVADAQSINESGSEPDNLGPPPIDDVIMPEDAIDDRIERDRLARATSLAGGVTSAPHQSLPAPVLSLPLLVVVEAATNNHVSGNDNDASGSPDAHIPGEGTNVGDYKVVAIEARAAPGPAIGAHLPVDGDRAGGNALAETPSFGAKLAGLMKRVHAAFMGILASVKRRFTPADKGQPEG